MNEEAIQDAYNLFVQTGYNQDINAFKQLIGSNPEALQDAYNLFVQTGYNQNIDSFKGLMGVGAVPMATPAPQPEEVKKKEESGTMELPVAGSLSGLPSQQEPKPAPTQAGMPQFFQSSLDIITPQLIDNTEEFVVPKMNYQFGPMGFKFEESGMTGDWMVATAPNGKTMEFSLDPAFGMGADKEANKLKSFISENTTTEALKAIENQYAAENKKFNNQKQIDEELASINQTAESFKNETNSYLAEKMSLDEEKKYFESVPANQVKDQAYLDRYAQYMQKGGDLARKEQELIKKQSDLQMRSQQLNSAVGKYVEMESKQGDYMGAGINAWWEGVGAQTAGIINNVIDLTFSKYLLGADEDDIKQSIEGKVSTGDAQEDAKTNVAIANALRINELRTSVNVSARDTRNKADIPLPQKGQSYVDWYNSLSEEDKTAIVDKSNDDIKKDLKINILPAAREGARAVLGDDNTTVAYSRLLEEGFWGGALLGTAKSLPALIGGNNAMGWATRTANMYAQNTDAIYKEMEQNPNFKDISEQEKFNIIAPIGITSAALESLGFRNVIANKGLLNRVALAAMGKAGATTTAKTFGDLVKNEAKTMLSKGLLTLTGAGLAEAETGAAQQVSEYAFKELYNAMKGKEMFITPDFMSAEYVKDIAKAGAQEMIGGFVLGTLPAISAAYSKQGYQAMDDNLFKIFEKGANDENFHKAIVADVKLKVSEGKMTLKEGKEMLNNYRNSIGLFNSLPDNLDTNEKKSAMNLLKEKRDLEQQISGKDEALTRRQRNRISEINTELETLSETAATRPRTITLPTGNEIQVDPEKASEVETLMSEYNQLTQERSNFEERSKVGTDGLFDVVTNTVEFFNSEQELNDELQKRWEQTDLAARQAEIVNEITALATPTAAPAPATQQEGILSSPEMTLAALEQLPTEDRTNLVFTQEDGTETPVMGNEQMLSNLYHQAMATPEAERTPAQLDAIDTVQVSLKTQLEQEAQQQAQAQQARPARGRNKGDIFRNTMKSLVSILPGIKVSFHENETEMKGFAETLGNDVSQQIFGGQNGVIVYDASGKPTNILINEETSDATTLPHEVWHAIFFKAFGDNPQLFNEFRDRTRQILLDNGYNEIVDLLDEFEQTEEYVNSNTQGEEWMVHLGGLLTASDIDTATLSKRSRSLFEQLKGLLNEFAKRITGQPMFLEDATPEDVLDFMVAISDRMSRGESIADFFRNQEERQGEGGTRVKPQIVGEGARLTEEVRADLNVAQQMEDAGKDAKTIRLATGWEKGADGKWRYETADNIPFLKDIVRLVMDYMKENKVEDNVYQKAEYFLPPELMSLYPELNDVTIQFDKGDGESLGEYNPLTNRIRVTIDDSPLKSVSIKNTISTLLHEVQHAIQEIEGFAKGGNPEGFKPDDTVKDYKQKVLSAIINNRLTKQKYRDINDARSYLMDLLTLNANGEGMPIGQFLNGILQDIDKMYDTVLYGGDQSDFNDYLLSDIYDFLNEKKVPENKVDEIVKQFDKFETAANEIGRSNDFQEIQENVFEQIEERPRSKYEFYKRLAGEVEARNVQARMNMTPEQRRQTTLQETEDVERKKQTVKAQSGETGIEENTTRQEFKKIIKEGWRGKRITINGTQYRIDNVSSGFGSPEVTLIDANGNIFYNEQKAFDGRIIKRLPTVSSLSYDLPSEQIVKAQSGKTGIETEGKSLFRTENDANIGWQYDSEKVARERFNISKLKKIGSGSDRVVFDLGDGKVLKVAKTARGLEQNIYEGDGYLTIIPNIFERGLNYVVTEKADRLKAADMVPVYNEDGEQTGEVRASEMINELQRFNQKDFDNHRGELQDVLMKYGLQEIMNYNVLWNDFTRIANWGYKDGMPMHTDGGTFGGVDMLTARPKNSLTDPEFREIYEKSKKAKKEFGDNDVYVKFQKSGNTGIEQVRKVAQRYNVNNQGFAPKQVNDSAMRRELEPLGYSVRRAKTDEQGRGGGVFIIDGNGRFFNPFRVKSQRISLGAGRLMDDITAIPGYDRMLEEVNAIIVRTKRRGASQERIMKGVMDYVMTSAVYERANDTQREQLVRNVQTEFGKRMKSAPSVGRLLGTIKDIKNITLSEKELLKQQIKSLARGARTATAAWRVASRELANEINELVLSGKVTTKQVSSIIKRFANVNMFNEDSIDKFVDYMTKVFEDANYAEKIERARRLLPTAKRNIRTKIGISEAAAPLLQQMFAINPNLIPDAVLDKYLSLVEMFGEKATVLTLADVNTVIATSNEILDAVDEEVSLAEELAIRFENYPDKVFDDDGKLDYAATLAQMQEENVITEDDAKLMQKYKNLILPKVQKPEMTEAEIEQEKDRLISVIGSLDVNDSALPTRDERDLAKELKSLLKPEILKQLTIPQLNNVIKLIDNINNGYLPHYAQLTVERLDSFKNKSYLTESVKTSVPLMFEKAYSRIKSAITKKGAISEMIRRNPLYNMDQIFGDFKTKNIYKALFEGMSKAQALFDSEINKVNKKLDEAHDAVAKSHGNDSNNTLLSSFKMMTYMLQLEYESNPGNKEVHPASKVLNATIKHIDNGKSRYGDKEADMLQEILTKYSTDGEIDIEALYDSFNPAEKKAIKTIQEINESLRDKAVYTAAVIRGDRINPLNNYVHHYVMHEFNPDESATGVQTADAYNNSMRPSTRAQSLIERTNKVSPMNFDVFASAQRGAKFVLLDYTMTQPIRTGRKTLNQTRIELEKNGRIPKEQRETFNAIESAFNEVVANVLTNNMITDSRVEEIVNFISKTGYRAILASVPRFVSELTSNLGTVIFDPKSFSDGIKLFKKMNGVDAENIMKNSKSVQTNRLYGGQALSGKFIDTSVLGQTTGIKSATAKGDVANVVNKIYNNSLKKYKNFVELTADTLISTPDKLVMRPFWMGAYANAFKKETGQDIDLDKVAANDEAYMNEYKDAIDKATDAADKMSVRVGATDNPFMGMLKGTVKPNQSGFTRAFNNFNNFMTRFAIYEYTTAREGIYAAMGNGMITKRQGYALLAGVAMRMTVYTLLSQMLGNGMLSLFADDDEDDEKTFMQKFGQSLASTATGLVLGRNFGNSTKSLINYGVEEMNEKFLTGLREGDYDPYKDAISYSIIPKERKGHKTNLTDFLTQIGGSFGPSLKTADLIARKMFEAPKKKEDAIERGKKETQIRIPLEVLGNLGYIPLYKDVRKVVMDQMYKDLENADKKVKDKKQAEKEMLRGYENKTDMKRYNPELYEQVFGEKSPGYDAEQAKKKIEKEKDDLERRRKDEFYDYTPKKTQEKSDGFGSKPFGGKAKKESGGFGSKKFGE